MQSHQNEAVFFDVHYPGFFQLIIILVGSTSNTFTISQSTTF